MTAYPHADRLVIERGGIEYSCEYSTSHGLSIDRPGYRNLLMAVHGSGSPGWDYFEIAEHLTRAHGRAHDTIVLGPQFTRHSSNPAHSDIDPADVGAFPDNALMWSGNPFHGYDADFPKNILGQGPAISSFDVIDGLIELAVQRLPDLQSITLFGQSGGGQLVQRYAFCSPLETELLDLHDIDIRYVVGNAGNYLFLDSIRPGPVSNCVLAFDQYGYGLGGAFPPYLGRRGTSVSAQTSRYADRNVIYLVGSEDVDPHHGSLPRGCASVAQGTHRYERSASVFESVVRRYGSPVMARHRHAVIPGVGHGARVFRRPEAHHFLFGPGGNEPTLARRGSSRVDAGTAQQIRVIAIEAPSLEGTFFRWNRDRSHYGSTDQIVTAQVDGAGELQLWSWQRRRSGELVSASVQGEGGHAGEVKSIDLARSRVDWRRHVREDGSVVVTSCITGSDRLMLIAWKVTEAGQFRRIDDTQAAPTQVTRQALTPVRVIDQVVSSRDNGVFATATRTADGEVAAQLWRLDYDTGSFTLIAAVDVLDDADDHLAIADVDESRIALLCSSQNRLRLVLLETDAVSQGGSSLTVSVSVDIGLVPRSPQMAIDQYGNAYVATLDDADAVHMTGFAINGTGVAKRGDWTVTDGAVGGDRSIRLVSLGHRGLLLGAPTGAGRLRLITLSVTPSAGTLRRVADSGNAIGVMQGFDLLAGDLPLSRALLCAVSDDSPASKLRLIGLEYNR